MLKNQASEIIPEELLKTIGKNLCKIRNEKNEEIKSVANAVEIKPALIEKIENGTDELSIRTLAILCNHYEISLQKVMELEGAQVYHFTQTNSAGNNHKQYVVNDHTNGYELLVQQLQSDVEYYRNKYTALTENKIS